MERRRPLRHTEEQIEEADRIARRPAPEVTAAALEAFDRRERRTLDRIVAALIRIRTLPRKDAPPCSF